MVLLRSRLYVVPMVRILLIFALLVTVSLKHFERAPVYAPATAPAISELATAAGISTTIVTASDCHDNDAGSFSQQRSSKSDCKAVIAIVAVNSISVPDDHVAAQQPTSISTARLVDLPPPIA